MNNKNENENTKIKLRLKLTKGRYASPAMASDFWHAFYGLCPQRIETLWTVLRNEYIKMKRASVKSPFASVRVVVEYSGHK